MDTGTISRGASIGGRVPAYSSTNVTAARLLCCLLLGALTAARYWTAYNPLATLQERIEPFSVARNLIDTGQFANPFGAMQTGLSAHLAPAFPALVALVMSRYGDGAAGAHVLNLISVIAMALQVAAFPLVASSLGMGFVTGLIAGALWLVAKPPLYASWECTIAALLLLTASWLFRRLIAARTPRAPASIALGLNIGILILLIQTVLPVIAVWIVWLARARGIGFFRKGALAVIFLPLLLVGGWTFRNYVVFHRLILVRDNLGLELAVSNNDCAVFGLFLSEETGCFQKEHPNVSPAEAQKLVQLGEPAYNAVRMREALHWIAANPGRFGRLTLARFVAFWFPNDTGSPVTELRKPGFRALRLVVYTMTLLSLLGLGILFRRDPVAAWLCALWMALFPAIYYAIQYIDRYRAPILWVTFVLGAFPIALASTRIVNAAFTVLHLRTEGRAH
jgi:hypothetical protein